MRLSLLLSDWMFTRSPRPSAVAEAGREAPRFVGTAGPVARRSCVKALSQVWASPSRLLDRVRGGAVRLRAGTSAAVRAAIAARWSRPPKIPRRPGERIKTDRRDALDAAQPACAPGDLTPVVVPDERDEAIRDLSRAREDAVRARLKARQQLKALLLRHGSTLHAARVPGRWLTSAIWPRCSFAHPAQDIAFVEYRNGGAARRTSASSVSRQALRDQIEQWRLQAVVAVPS